MVPILREIETETQKQPHSWILALTSTSCSICSCQKPYCHHPQGTATRERGQGRRPRHTSLPARVPQTTRDSSPLEVKALPFPSSTFSLVGPSLPNSVMNKGFMEERAAS